MARINQGIFTKLSRDFRNLETEYKNAISQYFGNGEWNCNCDFFSDFAYSADAIYMDANNFESEIQGMLDSTKFEDADKRAKYEKMQQSSQEIRYKIKSKFDEVLSMIKMSGGYISDAEQRTLNELSIYKYE